MKKTICKVISIIMVAVCIYAFVLCVKVFVEPSHSFYDFSTQISAIYGGVGAISALIAFITGKIGWERQ